jgi:two-component system response regulator MtrA
MLSLPGPPPAPLILLAESDAELREAHALFLGVAGFRAIQARGGHTAIEYARSFHPNVIVGDLDPRALPGLWLWPKLAAAAPNAVLVGVTGTVAPTDASAALLAGVHTLVPRPLSSHALLLEIEWVLAHGATLRSKSLTLRSLAESGRLKSETLLERSKALRARFERLRTATGGTAGRDSTD